ncbi:MAG TPA: Bor family protein [Candidatus Eisenbacteria bacterium]|nr:Bor family protein [Candidatus Eisenbacteria bacterium]
MPTPRAFVLVLLLASVTGCYAARVDTGLTPSAKVIEQKWASSWIYGLVPPKTIKAATECKDGVAIVETQLSFLNQVVSILTFGIYTPMQIVVTCASGAATGMRDGDGSMFLPENASDEDAQRVFAQAADRAVATRHAVFVRRIPAEDAGVPQ